MLEVLSKDALSTFYVMCLEKKHAQISSNVCFVAKFHRPRIHE